MYGHSPTTALRLLFIFEPVATQFEQVLHKEAKTISALSVSTFTNDGMNTASRIRPNFGQTLVFLGALFAATSGQQR